MVKKLLILTISVFLICSTAANAETVTEPFSLKIERSQNGDSIIQKMIVRGTVSDDYIYAPVTLAVLNPVSDDGQELTFTEKYAALHQTYVRANGTYEFDFHFNPPYGIYKVLVKVGNDEIASATIECFTIDDLVELLSGLKNGTMTPEKLSEILTEKSANIGIDCSNFNSFANDDNKLAVCAGIINDMTVFTVDELAEALNKNVLLVCFAEADWSLKDSIVNLFKDDYGDELKNTTEKYNKLSEELKKDVMNNMNSAFTDIASLVSSMRSNMVMSTYNDIDNYSQIETLLNDFGEYFNIPDVIAEMNSFSDNKKNIAYSYILKQRASSDGLSGLIDAVKYAVENIDTLLEENSSSTSGTTPGASLGGGGGGGGGIAAPGNIVTVKPDETDETVKEAIDVVQTVSFKDLNDAAWAKTAVNYLVSQKVVSGKSNEIFAPLEDVTRAEFAKMVSLAFNITQSGTVKTFDDVDENHWAFSYINKLYSTGIVQGVSGNKFNPDSYITRQDIAVILYRAMVVRNLERFDLNGYEISFTDSDSISDYAKRAVGILAEVKIINGFEDNTIKPFNNATRAETAVLLYNAMQFNK